MWIIVLFCGCLLPSVLGQQSYNNNPVNVGTSPIVVSSPNYANYYSPGSRCSWPITTFSDYRIRLTCTVVQVPNQNNGCPLDYISVSRTGRADHADGYRYCGTGTFEEFSDYNQMNIALFSQLNSPGGRFYCTVRAFFEPCNCGRRKSTRIVGGQNAAVNEFPMMVAIYDLNTRTIICGATLISEQRAVTAQHCLANQTPGSIVLVVGEHDISVGSDTPYTAVYNVESFVCYTDCNLNTNNQNDIALIKTTTPIQMNPGVGIACLPFKYNTNTVSQFSGYTVEAAGWGTTEFSGPRPNILQKVQLNVISQPQCQSVLGSAINNNHICTFTTNKDTCQYDSGGGLWWTGPDNGRLYVIGINSFGVACADNRTPSVATRVTQYLNWIMVNSPESRYCSV
ncbi:venom serine protease-like [Phlebotomus papatasi]|uniref:venom serine protease-like n=1 Tax=Phlebotomus papatasi TaxID=29031 RepID=UPI002483433B|nr:venom serine protease-like [Phlebotomus papatasi]